MSQEEIWTEPSSQSTTHEHRQPGAGGGNSGSSLGLRSNAILEHSQETRLAGDEQARGDLNDHQRRIQTNVAEKSLSASLALYLHGPDPDLLSEPSPLTGPTGRIRTYGLYPDLQFLLSHHTNRIRTCDEHTSVLRQHYTDRTIITT